MSQLTVHKRNQGFVILAGAVMLMFVIPIVGLAIDAGFLFAVKAKLSAAADAAALAAARSLAVGLTLADQEASARSRAQAFFAANYPNESFNTTPQSLVVDVAETAFRTRTVTVTASVNSPLFFMRILNSAGSTIVAASGRASRRDVNVMMVIDRSGSMNSNGGCAAVRNAANGFIDLFANQRDRLGMITYGISYALSFAPSMNFKTGSPTLTSVVNSITCAGGTGTAQAFYKGYEQIAQINEPGALNVILLFTDGVPNTVTANYPINVLDTNRNADQVSLGGHARRNSRCYDWENAKRWHATGNPGAQQSSWNPVNQVFRGAVYAQENAPDGSADAVIGIQGYTTTNFTDPGSVSRPYPSATSSTQYTGGSNNDCWFRGGSGHTGAGEGTGTSHAQYDIAYYPDTDLYGTALRGDFVSVGNFPVGHPYQGKIDIRNRTNMMRSAMNAVDNVGKRIRNNDLNSGINTVVYAIGLGVLGPTQDALLARVANDPSSPIFDENKLVGMYQPAPTAADLNAAFVRIASEILRYVQ